MEFNVIGGMQPQQKGHTVKKVRLFGVTYNLSEISIGMLLLIPSAAFLLFVFVIPVIQVI